MVAVGLGILTAVTWGAADFIAGVMSRRISVWIVAVVAQLCGLALVAIGVALFAGEVPTAREFLLGALAGVSVALGATCYYSALAAGPMGLASAIAASGAVVPVVWGIAIGQAGSAVELSGAVAALAGAILVVWADEPEGDGRAARRKRILLALGAALGFGWFIVVVDQVGDADVLWLLLGIRAASLVVLVAGFLITRPRFELGTGALLVAASVGLLDVLAQTSIHAATSAGNLAAVSVLASLYAMVTVILARAVLRERMSRLQMGAIALVMAGVALIALG